MLAAVAANAADTIDLSGAVVVGPDDAKVVRTAQRMLAEEIAKRTDITLPREAAFGDGQANPLIYPQIFNHPGVRSHFFGLHPQHITDASTQYMPDFTLTPLVRGHLPCSFATDGKPSNTLRVLLQPTCSRYLDAGDWAVQPSVRAIRCPPFLTVSAVTCGCIAPAKGSFEDLFQHSFKARFLTQGMLPILTPGITRPSVARPAA